MDKKLRLAVATTDGKVVNQHFGKADRFLILEITTEGTIKSSDVREVTPVCNLGNHDENALERNATVLDDCDWILASRVGDGARMVLEQHGITVFECPGIIEESVKNAVTFLKLETLRKEFGI